MKKLIIIFALSLFLLTGCGGNTTENNIIEIDEKMFVTQTNDIYINQEEYLDQTIRYEGIFRISPSTDGQSSSFYVFRYGPGCCGNDGEVGFEVLWDGDTIDDDAWVEVTGTLQKAEDELERLVVNATSLTVLTTRGEEIVTQ